jgi:hypothetical protein
MKRLFLMLVLTAATAHAVPTTAGAEGAKGPGLWNPATVATVAGTVESVDRIEMGERWRCVRLQIATADGAVQVRVGPDWYVADSKLAFAKGDRVEVKGSRLTFAGEKSMVAAEIVRGAERIVLRDGLGRPAWAAK